MNKIIGIYKITSPSNKVYIGQSIDIKSRFKKYKRLNCKSQHKLFRSLKKYGVSAHKFEIIHECEVNELNEKERYYQELYSVIGKNGLNCILTDTKNEKRVMSEETKNKIGIGNKGKTKGRIMPESEKEKLRNFYKNKRIAEGKPEPIKKPKKIRDEYGNCILTERTKNKINIEKENKKPLKGLIHFHKNKKKWMLNLVINKKTVYAGMFKNKEEAIIRLNILIENINNNK